jgi:hypothetical protein
VIDDLATEPREPLGYRLAQRAHAHQAHCGAVKARPVQLGTPASEPAVSDLAVGLANPAHDPDDQANGQLGGGSDDRVGHDGQPYPTPGAGLGIEVVVALQSGADHPKPPAAG